jgi:cyclopropane-fatty-acyl-phospholipid synthase
MPLTDPTDLDEAARSSAYPLGVRAAAEPLLRRLDRWCLNRLAQAFAGSPIRLELWDGTSVDMSASAPLGSVHVGDRATLVRLVTRPAELAFGEAYTAGRLTVQGDLAQILDGINRALADRWPVPRRRPPAASPTSARRNVHAHYDLGNEFYQLWLDEAMVYTCAYFEQPDASLEEAQRAKLELVCRKLRLQPGERVVEAGCGWGALAVYMAKHYGVSVRAYNISEPQLEHARARAKREGLERQVVFVNGDYRTIDGSCDAFVSIGMLEHVGRDQYSTLGGVMDRILDRAHGRGLLHFIGRVRPRPFDLWTTRYIFPGAYAPALGEVLPDAIESYGFAVTDVENLRLHYAKTLQHWNTRFEDHVETVRERFGETFVRTWRLYLASAQASFLSGTLELFQVAFDRARDNDVPWTRRAIYAAAAVPAPQSHGSV